MSEQPTPVMGDQPVLQLPSSLGVFRRRPFLLAVAQNQTDAHWYSARDDFHTNYLFFSNNEIYACDRCRSDRIAVRRPEISTRNPQHQQSEKRQESEKHQESEEHQGPEKHGFEMEWLAPETESLMCMLERRNRTWTVKLRKVLYDARKEIRNHIYVSENMSRFWYNATEHFKTEARASGDKGYKSLPSPRIPRLEKNPIAYRCCDHGFLPAGLVMEHIPPVLPDHARALVNSYIAPSVRNSVKDDPNMENVRFLVRFGEQLPPYEALNTNLLSRPVYLDQLKRQNRHDVKNWIDGMGASLAILHWVCRFDGAGVEFHLAPKPNRKNPRLWMTHFGDCDTIKGPDDTTAMAKAFCNNPAWPQPQSISKECSDKMWRWREDTFKRFKYAYSSTSDYLLAESPSQQHLPRRFLKKVECMKLDDQGIEYETSEGFTV
ncbi:Ff.00g043850.m01.CDS01 [Fusarium sp. VM40]|nr:Ff.00g043850.m01.CDS01 [Fusarium sp. VM40]